jgi:hypothetical protein
MPSLCVRQPVQVEAQPVLQRHGAVRTPDLRFRAVGQQTILRQVLTPGLLRVQTQTQILQQQLAVQVTVYILDPKI